jgi:transposase InsO family protein
VDLNRNRLFTKWIESIPTRSASHKVIINFLEDIMERFGCPNIIITNNAASFKDEPLIKFCEQFKLTLIHSTPYYLQGNGLAECFDKSLINIIKIFLEDNKKAWDSKLKFSLWDDRMKKERSLDISPFQLVYGTEIVLPSQLALPVEKFFQYCHREPNDMIEIIHQLVEFQ